MSPVSNGNPAFRRARSSARASEAEGSPRRLRPSSIRKRGSILAAAIACFARGGYEETTLDEIAAMAGVSKQTIYSHFPDKERLFLAAIESVTARAAQFVDELVAGLAESDDLEADLKEMASRWLLIVLDPQVIEIRRLLIAESRRFPALAAAYYEHGPGRVLAGLAGSLETLAERRLVAIDDPALAAQHLAWLVVAPIDRAMFYGEGHGISRARAAEIAERGVAVFLAAYRVEPRRD